MSVLKAKRSLSCLEFYKNALEVRKTVTMWMMKDFGTRRNPRTVNQVIKNIDKEDQKVIDEIFSKYNRVSKYTYRTECPEWFLDFERHRVSDILYNLVADITAADSICPKFDYEWGQRRELQNKAIGDCRKLYQELSYIINLFPADLNKFKTILEQIEKEEELLLGWRKSDIRIQEHGKLCRDRL